LKIVKVTVIVSSEGALYVILPYDYSAPTFWAHTGPRQQLEHKCYDDFVTMITIMTEITKIWWNIKWHEMWNDTKCQMTQNVKWHLMSNDTQCKMTQTVKWQEMSNDTKWKIKRYDTWHITWHMTNDK